MESNKKVKVSVIIKYVSDKQDEELNNANGDAYVVMNEIRKILQAVSSKNENEDSEKVLHLLRATKTSNEVMASAFAEAEREDLFDEKVSTIDAINEIINKINNESI